MIGGVFDKNWLEKTKNEDSYNSFNSYDGSYQNHSRSTCRHWCTSHGIAIALTFGSHCGMTERHYL